MNADTRLKPVEVPPLSRTTSYSPAWAASVPRRQGVYLIHDLRGVLYVGRSDDLQRRFYEHLESETNDLLNAAIRAPSGPLHFSWIITSDARDLEKRLIRGFQPPCNRIVYKEI